MTPASSSLSSSSSCAGWIQKRDSCRAKHGDKSEKCCQSTLRAKRCLAFEHCLVEARNYYGEPNEGIKYLCSAFYESHCFGNPRVMAVDTANATSDRTRIFEYHQKAKRRVGSNKQQYRECQDLSGRLHRCLERNFVQF